MCLSVSVSAACLSIQPVSLLARMFGLEFICLSMCLEPGNYLKIVFCSFVTGQSACFCDNIFCVVCVCIDTVSECLRPRACGCCVCAPARVCMGVVSGCRRVCVWVLCLRPCACEYGCCVWVQARRSSKACGRNREIVGNQGASVGTEDEENSWIGKAASVSTVFRRTMSPLRPSSKP